MRKETVFKTIIESGHDCGLKNVCIFGSMDSDRRKIMKEYIKYVIQHTYNDIYIVGNLKNEYDDAILYQDVITLGKYGKGSAYINPMDYPVKHPEFLCNGKDSFVYAKYDVLCSICSMIYKNVTHTELEPFDLKIIRNALDGMYGNMDISGTMPTLYHFASELFHLRTQQSNNIAETIVNYLMHNPGFAMNTNVKSDCRIHAFNIPDNVSIPGLYMTSTLNYIWMQVLENASMGKQTWVFVDNIEMIMHDVHAMEYFVTMVKKGRPYGAHICVPMDAGSFAETEEMRSITWHSPYIIALPMEASEASAFSNAFYYRDQTKHIEALKKLLYGDSCELGTFRYPEENHAGEDEYFCSIEP